MLNLRNYKDIEKICNRLLKILIKEYSYYPAEELYVCIDSTEITYVEEDPSTTIYIKFGRDCGVGHTDNWQKELDINLIDDSLDFIAGQFFQKIIDEDL